MTDTPSTLHCSPMDTQIFNQALSVEAVSAYIIITALIADNVRPLLTSVRDRWNGEPADDQPGGLLASLDELEALNVIEHHPGLEGEGPLFMVNPASLWGAPKQWPDPKPLPINPR